MFVDVDGAHTSLKPSFERASRSGGNLARIAREARLSASEY